MNEASSQNEAIKHFVQSELGCSCPEAVFEHIQRITDFDALPAFNRIYDIGGRLLVAISRPEKWREIGTQLEQWVDAGKEYRDHHGYNRFRLVVVADDSQAAEILHGIFNSLLNADEHIHLHVVEPRVLPADE
jgi:hypothetical protein